MLEQPPDVVPRILEAGEALAAGEVGGLGEHVRALSVSAVKHRAGVWDVDLQQRGGKRPVGLGVEAHQRGITDPYLCVNWEVVGVDGVGGQRLTRFEYVADELDKPRSRPPGR